MVGQVFNIPPQPRVLENTRDVPAGVITFGGEYRNLDRRLTATYVANADHLTEREARSPKGESSDEGRPGEHAIDEVETVARCARDAHRAPSSP